LDELGENVIIFLVAGSGTTAVTTTYFIWELGRRPEVHKKVAEEIRTAFPDPQIFPKYEEASKLVSSPRCFNGGDVASSIDTITLALLECGH